MIYQSELERKLVEEGYDSFDVIAKNNLIATLANREGLLFNEVTDEYILNHHKQLKKDLFDEMCETKIVDGFVCSNGHTYRCNRDDQVNMMGKKEQIKDDPAIETVMWRTEDSGYVALNRDEFLTVVYKEAFKHKEDTIFKYNVIKGQIAAATSHTELLAIVWE